MPWYIMCVRGVEYITWSYGACYLAKVPCVCRCIGAGVGGLGTEEGRGRGGVGERKRASTSE